MFYYYGAKHQLSKRGLYPSPAHEVIVEPFAGAAGYSCYWAERSPNRHRVVLWDKDERVVSAWHHLLNGGRMPDRPSVGEYTDDFLIMTAAASNAIGKLKRLKVTPRVVKVYDGMARRVERVLPYMVGRTSVHHGGYEEAGSLRESATWFIDPPYQPPKAQRNKTAHPRGLGYAAGCTSADLDFDALAAWSKGRDGQVIVCEQEGADWLDFRPLVQHQNSQGSMSTEVVWIAALRDGT